MDVTIRQLPVCKGSSWHVSLTTWCEKKFYCKNGHKLYYITFYYTAVTCFQSIVSITAHIVRPAYPENALYQTDAQTIIFTIWHLYFRYDNSNSILNVFILQWLPYGH